MFRNVLCLGLALVAAPHAVAAEPPPEQTFDYVSRLDGGCIEGVLTSAYEVGCGYTTRAQMTEAGYLAIYKRVYWLLGVPHESWNFDVRANFPEGSESRLCSALGSYKLDYPEAIKIAGGVVGSSSDVCVDDLGGYCPDQAAAKALRDAGRHLSTAKELTFNLTAEGKFQQLAMRADFNRVLTAIDACIGQLLARARR